jgi:hypothetical protein
MASKAPHKSAAYDEDVVCRRFGAPSGGAHKMIRIGHLEDHFGLAIGSEQWVLCGRPFVLPMMLVSRLTCNCRLKPPIHDSFPARGALKSNIDRLSGWNLVQAPATGGDPAAKFSLRVSEISFIRVFALILLLSTRYWPLLGFAGLPPA